MIMRPGHVLEAESDLYLSVGLVEDAVFSPLMCTCTCCSSLITSESLKDLMCLGTTWY